MIKGHCDQEMLSSRDITYKNREHPVTFQRRYITYKRRSDQGTFSTVGDVVIREVPWMRGGGGGGWSACWT